MFNPQSQSGHVKHHTHRPTQWRLLTLLLLMGLLPGCLGTIVGTAVDTTIEVAKVPFKVGGAVVDIAAGDDEDED